MTVTRDVIVDLLPLYLEGEVSTDTRSLVESYLEQDSELSEIAEQTLEALAGGPPHVDRKENGMKAYERAKRWMFLRTVAIAMIVSVTILAFLAFAGVFWMMVVR